MSWLGAQFWLIPILPLVASAVIAVLPRRAKGPAVILALGAMGLSLVLSSAAFVATLGDQGGSAGPRILNFDWFELGTGTIRLGLLLDPLAGVMLMIVSLVGLLIFVFSTAYMSQDDNVARFFGFLSLFAAAMLGLVIANSLLLLFACWELMGLASYLLIGFWFQKPAAAAAAKKAFVVTRIGDLGLFLGLLWLARETGTLLFLDDGQGCLEAPALAGLSTTLVIGSMSSATAIALLLFAGAIGKSGQWPLHVWLPDAMEGPTPVSALIHAATMVAAGVFLVARTFPLFAAGGEGAAAAATSPALSVVTAVGAGTAVFAALLAVAQSDIKRILAYSTVSQLGYMFLGLGTGGVAVGMFHLMTHAFFKALLFLGAGSVIHGCHHEQDVRRLGGLRKLMPITFATYAIGMMALAGVPLLFSGFWSKDEILHAAWEWHAKWPFALGLFGAFLTAFYMTRQVGEVFFGEFRGNAPDSQAHGHRAGNAVGAHESPAPGESPATMTLPLVGLAVFAVLLGFLGTPAWPWFEGYLASHAAEFVPGRLTAALPMMVISTVVVAVGIGLGGYLYILRPRRTAEAIDPLETFMPRTFAALRGGLFFDELYAATVVRIHRALAWLASWLDELVIGGLVMGAGLTFRLMAWAMHWVDELLVNAGFDAGCHTVRWGGRFLSRWQNGRVQWYLGGLGVGMVVLAILILWGMAVT